MACRLLNWVLLVMQHGVTEPCRHILSVVLMNACVSTCLVSIGRFITRTGQGLVLEHKSRPFLKIQRSI